MKGELGWVNMRQSRYFLATGFPEGRRARPETGSSAGEHGSLSGLVDPGSGSLVAQPLVPRSRLCGYTKQMQGRT